MLTLSFFILIHVRDEKKIALVFLGMISWLHEVVGQVVGQSSERNSSAFRNKGKYPTLTEVVGQSSERNSRNKGKYPTLTENFLEWGISRAS